MIYCCFDHALCDVDVPGDVGAHARSEVERLSTYSKDAPRWCGREEGSVSGERFR